MKKIFIGSSTQALDIARAVQGILEKLGAETTCWRDDTAFPLSHNTIDNLLQAAHAHSGGVFILNRDDRLAAADPDGQERYVPRDNVIAEAGMFAGVLGKESVVLCTVPGVHEVSDFKGITQLNYDPQDRDRLENKLRYWLAQDVRDYTGPDRKNVLMLPRREVHNRYSIDSRFHISDGLYRQVNRVRIMNFASNILLNPEIGEREHQPAGDVRLSEAVQKIMEETHAKVELILSEPNPYNLRDLKTKVADYNAGTAAGSLYSALTTLHEKLTTDTVFRRNSTSMPVLFHYYVMRTSLPFGTLNVEFLGEARRFNHVKVDLYSAALDEEGNRRSFVVWQREDPENYQFFVDNFNAIKKNALLCQQPTLKTLGAWREKWEKSLRGGGI